MTNANHDGISMASSMVRMMERLPAAFAVTAGPNHALIYANAPFRSLVARDADVLALGSCLVDAFVEPSRAGLQGLLDRALFSGSVARNRRIDHSENGALPLVCTVWPDIGNDGNAEQLVIELRLATPGELSIAIQREVAERLLLSALREQDAAEIAETARRGSAFLESESRRLSQSLDVEETLAAMERMSLPVDGAWCFVDTLHNDDDSVHRLAIVHPDPTKQALLDELEGRWLPHPDDSFGLPATLRSPETSVVAEDVDAALVHSAQDPEVLRILRAIGIGPMLTVPLVIGDHLVGAVTFVGGGHGTPFTNEDVALAQDLAVRSAMALDRARTHAEVVALKVRAESASAAKSAFLGMMSHELRTPLNAISGYVELMELEVHGPITAAQRVDLARIRSNQRYLLGLINDLLKVTSAGGGQLVYSIADVGAHELMAESVALVEPLIAQRRLTHDLLLCDPSIVARADREKVKQILVNLLSNAIKFTPAGGKIVIDCNTREDVVHLRVCDTGIGIPTDKLDVIFDPFVQVLGGSAMHEGGIGLGLAISRGLARGMHGDLTVESTLGQGARFSLTLPSRRRSDGSINQSAPPG